ncbi:hypothetical protein L1987_16201 [Smallanthus sonchifolius]|uniref:Uncharacterized protein n=1 Tax=Smallanthus sonchifolius TaxID=185202 RepID=A0ACB9J834_9ASTR|nr:hypothetical protein L1987_16201 [Smallanthus sonchifolius]
MLVIVINPRPVRADVSSYHIQRLGMHVEIIPCLTNMLSMLTNGSQTVHLVLIEEEVWDQDSLVFVDKLRNLNHKIPPKLLLLLNSICQSNLLSCPPIATKPLRMNTLAGALGGNEDNARNGESVELSSSKLLAGRKILVVDDNIVNRRVTKVSLMRYGAEVECANTVTKAISLLKLPHSFDACFMDIQMPEMGG